jgi:hypothetical protein
MTERSAGSPAADYAALDRLRGRSCDRSLKAKATREFASDFYGGLSYSRWPSLSHDPQISHDPQEASWPKSSKQPEPLTIGSTQALSVAPRAQPSSRVSAGGEAAR